MACSEDKGHTLKIPDRIVNLRNQALALKTLARIFLNHRQSLGIRSPRAFPGAFLTIGSSTQEKRGGHFVWEAQ